MTKSELITVLKSEHDITNNEAKAIVNLVFDEMSAALSNGDRIEIRGFCTMLTDVNYSFSSTTIKIP